MASQRYPTVNVQNAGSWPHRPSAPQNTSALRSTVETTRGAGHDEPDAHSFNGPLYPPSNRFLTPSGRWMNPMMIRPIDSSYSTTTQAMSASADHNMPLLPSPFPQYAVQNQHYAPPNSLPPLLSNNAEQNVVHHDYYNPTPPSSSSSSTSPSSMSSRSIETLDSPVTLQHQPPQHSRYQHQHHHSDPFIYSATSGYAPEDPFHMSRGPPPFQPQYVGQNTSYAPFVMPLNADVYGTHQASKPPPTIDAFNSAVVAASSSPSSSRRKQHRPSFSAGSSGDLEFFPQGTRTPRSVHRSKPASPTNSRMSSVSPYQRRGPAGGHRASNASAPAHMGLDSSFLMLDMPNTIGSSSSMTLTASAPQAPKPAVVHPFRTFPEHVQIDPQFPLLYRKFYVPSYFSPTDALGNFVFMNSPESRPFPLQRLAFNTPSHVLDLYTPRYVKGSGSDKVGLCPICIEPISRGGEGTKLFLKTKVSAYNYHMQYYHGICARSNAPFSPPLESRITPRPRASIKERKEIKEGKCHVCMQWVPLQGTKDVEVMVKEIFWWKHAASCHKGTNIEGERDSFVEDDMVYQRVKEYESTKDSVGQH